MSIFLGCDPTRKNLLTKTARAVAKEGGFKAAAAALRKIENTFIEQSKAGAKEDNPLWALRLYDWSLEHQAALCKAFEDVDQGDGTVAKEDFVSVIQKQCVFSSPDAAEVDNGTSAGRDSSCRKHSQSIIYPVS